MNCLLVSATAKEIEPFLDYYRRHDNRPDIDILISGIGLTAATYALTRQINLKKPGIIIQAGIAGCYDPNISLGSVVVVKQDVLADQSVVENKQLKTMFDLDMAIPDQPPYYKGWLVNSNSKLIRQTKLKSVNAVSVNHITTSKQMMQYYREKFNPAIESMEGAALHYVCLSEKIPFLQIRSVSNYIGERNKKNWNIQDAVIHLNKALISCINKL
jgi:futalosine hydrolase